MDACDRRILDRLQAGVPTVRLPFDVVGQDLGVSEAEVLSRLQRLRDEGCWSFLGPIFDTQAAGHRSSLVAQAVEPARLETAALVVADCPGVSHCYEREHELNLWWTLAVPPGHSLAEVARGLARRNGAERTLLLPERRRFKLEVRFALGTSPPPAATRFSSSGCRTKHRPLTADDIVALRTLQAGLPLASDPWLSLSDGDEPRAASLLGSLQDLLARGVARRVALLVRHRHVGYGANGMAVWSVSEERSSAVGACLAEAPEASHAYQRRRAAGWPYSHYAMLHGRERSDVLAAAERVAGRALLPAPLLLWSGREFKKVRLELFTKRYDDWLSTFERKPCDGQAVGGVPA